MYIYIYSFIVMFNVEEDPPNKLVPATAYVHYNQPFNASLLKLLRQKARLAMLA